MRGSLVAVVGACASGKTTLVDMLREHGIRAVSLAQEHSSAPSLYLRSAPDYVVYLDVSYEEIRRRRKINWGPERLQTQKMRLRRSMEDADLVICTDGVEPSRVCDLVMDYLEEEGEVIIETDVGQPQRRCGDHCLPGAR